MDFLRTRPGHGLRTWVTQSEQDMGDILSFSLRRFRGHAVENCFVAQGAPASGRSGAGAPSNASGHLPPLRHQPENRRQMAGAISAARAGGFARSVAPSAPLAHPIVGALDSAHRSVAPAASALGGQENSSPAPPKVPARAGAGAGHPPARGSNAWVGCAPARAANWAATKACRGPFRRRGIFSAPCGQANSTWEAL